MNKNLKVIDMILTPSDRKIDYLNCLRGISLLAFSMQHLHPQPQQPSDRQKLLHYPVWISAGLRLVTAQAPWKGCVPNAPSRFGITPYSLSDIAALRKHSIAIKL